MFSPSKYKKYIDDTFGSLCACYDLTKTELLEAVINIFTLKDIQLLVQAIKLSSHRGLTLNQVNQLKVLNAYISTVLSKAGG